LWKISAHFFCEAWRAQLTYADSARGAAGAAMAFLFAKRGALCGVGIFAF